MNAELNDGNTIERHPVRIHLFGLVPVGNGEPSDVNTHCGTTVERLLSEYPGAEDVRDVRLGEGTEAVRGLLAAAYAAVDAGGCDVLVLDRLSSVSRRLPHF